MSMKRSYNVGFKLKVIDYYNNMIEPNITQTAYHFGLKRDNIKRWIWNRDIILEKVDEARKIRKLEHFKKQRKMHPGRKTILTKEIESQISTEIIDMRRDGIKIDNFILKKKG